MRTTLALTAVVLALCTPAARAATAPVDYLRDVKPLLATRCYACHGALKQKEGLRLDTAALIRKGGTSGPAVVPGDPDKSLLIHHVTEHGDAALMPPEGEGERFKPAELALLKAWIAAGATGPADEKPEADPREHWAFQPIRRPPLPPIGNPQSAIGNPIDALLAAEWSKHNLTPQPPAPRGVWLRRVHLDLTGLPPTPAEHAAYLADASPDADAKVVDRLLASPQYGERWGRHWMDVWRFSDWWGLGADVRNSQKHIWHWRDWIVESLNADKGYDQMAREMLAADELYPTDDDRLRATGYLVRQYFKFNRNTWLEETVEHTGKAFLGLTLNCAKCHDHKFDPISQEEFYRFRAFFEPYQLRHDMDAGQTDFEKAGRPRAFDCNPDAPTYLFVRGDERQPKKDKAIAPGVPSIVSFGELAIRPIDLPAAAHAPGLRPEVVAAYVTEAEAKLAAARKAVATARNVAATRPETFGPPARAQAVVTLTLDHAEKSLAAAVAQADAVHARAAADRVGTAGLASVGLANPLARPALLAERRAAVAAAEEALAVAQLDAAKSPANAKKIAPAHAALANLRQSLHAPGDRHTPIRGALKTPESNVETEESRNKPFPTTSTGRRTALANWITDPRNPLTARVAANHVWARHVGRPLVASVFDFGRKGATPTHRELLDLLASELRDNGWSMKRLHRLICTSRAYRMSSSARAVTQDSGLSTQDSSKLDPDNRHLWRMNPIRMESQVIRDALLHLAGDLDLTTGGPSVPTADESSRRRSLYFVHSNTDKHKFLTAFDDASPLECYRRAESIVPQQALALENSKLVSAAAAKIAKRIEAADDAAFVTAAFNLILGNAPTADERAACEPFLAHARETAKSEKRPDPAARARTNLVHALLNHNDFVTIR